MDGLSTGEIAKQGGVNLETIRYYERRGLLPKPPRTPSGYRTFDPEAVRRIRFIKQAQGLGFSLKEIKALLALRVDPCSSCVPGIVAALLPSLTCPLCWPAYAGVLSSLGVGFVGTTAYLLPLTATFLAIAVGALTFGARRHGRHGPLALGLVGSAIVLLGKFVLDATPATLGGVGTLVAASVWNVWPRRATAFPCSACVPAVTGSTKATVTEVSA